MAARARSRRKIPAPSSGKVAVVFVVVTVVILLVVGWVLVHGGLGEIPLPGKETIRQFLSGEAGQKESRDELQATINRLEKRIREMEESHRAELAALKERYEQQLDELKLRVKLLQDENKRLQESSGN